MQKAHGKQLSALVSTADAGLPVCFHTTANEGGSFKAATKSCTPVKGSCFPTGYSVMTLMEHCPQAFQEGYTLLAGSHVGEDGEDLSRQVIHALEERKPQGTKKMKI